MEIQRASVDQLRTRAGTLLAAASLVTSFLGGQALSQGHDPGTWGVIALLAFILTAGLCVWVLMPEEFNWFMSPAAIVDDYADDPDVSSADAMRDLALHYDESLNANKSAVEALQCRYRLAAICLAVEVVTWIPAQPGGGLLA
ncbi:hypothetical protein [Conexibacter sp. SYSU D00693]|uniref:hypothetical protein n=1 Tax=Conexibacter sp. SYSU D00693 TaxID=2812560 RepID=UPI00196B8534|nr:hypothetical protein [Conexibacter sp. SYSU D00693]